MLTTVRRTNETQKRSRRVRARNLFMEETREEAEVISKQD